MNEQLARETLDSFHDEWHFDSLARLIEDLSHQRHPHAPHLSHTDYVMLIHALWMMTHGLDVPTVSYNVPIQALYVAMRMDGTGHALAEMLALQMPPMSNSDREFLEGHCNGSQFADTPAVGDYYAAEARANGIDIKGRVYVPGLALYAGDPRAWVADRSEAAAVARERNMTLMGSVNTKTQDLGPPPPDITIADDLVEEQVQSRIEDNPELALGDLGELRHEVREQMKPHWGD